jgi:integrase
VVKQIRRLTARGVATQNQPGRHADGDNLYLDISAQGQKKWTFRYRSPTHRVADGQKNVGKLRDMGLGSVRNVSLATARERASAARQLIHDGIDPLDARHAQKNRTPKPTFGEMAKQVISALEPGWNNERHADQWRTSTQVYCADILDKCVDEIDTSDVLGVLQPIWQTKAKTAARIRGRIERILDAAKATGHRSGENPARWRGHLDTWLPKPERLQRGHHPAMPWPHVPAFVSSLRERATVTSFALEFVIQNASRSGEVLKSVRGGEIHGVRWSEIDREARVWTVPAARMKTRHPHRVPLSTRAIEILDHMMEFRQGDFIFPGKHGDTPLSATALEQLMRRMNAKPYTVHGFRSSFSDWAGDSTDFPRELIEAALSHLVGNSVERAYRRGDALERRRELMEAWSQFLDQN